MDMKKNRRFIIGATIGADLFCDLHAAEACQTPDRSSVRRRAVPQQLEGTPPATPERVNRYNDLVTPLTPDLTLSQIVDKYKRLQAYCRKLSEALRKARLEHPSAATAVPADAEKTVEALRIELVEARGQREQAERKAMVWKQAAMISGVSVLVILLRLVAYFMGLSF